MRSAGNVGGTLVLLWWSYKIYIAIQVKLKNKTVHN